MPSFLICDAEWDALVDEPHQLLKVYCAIRMHMDYRTGISGEVRRLSEQMLVEVLSIPASPGRPAHKATRKEIRYAIDALVRRQLLEPMGSIGPFVFHLPKAERDNSVSGRWGQRFVTGGAIPGALGGANDIQPEGADLLPFRQNDGVGGALGWAGGLTEVGPEVGPTSGLPTQELPTPLPRASPDPPDRFPMHDGWAPSPKGWPATLMRNGMQGYRLKDDDLLEFRSYWVNRPDKYQSQGQWEHQLAMTVKSNQVRETGRSSYGHQTAPGTPEARGRNGQRSLSAVEQVERAIDEQRASLAKACGAPGAPAAGEALADDGADLRAPLDVEFWREADA